MNGLERYDAVLRQKPPDKIPIRIGNYNMFICNYYGMTVRQYVDDPALNAETFVKFVREFGFDSVKAGLGYILYGCGPELGPEWKFVKGDFPACVRGIIDKPGDIQKVTLPDTPTGYFKNFIEINQRVKEAIGNELSLGISILGPYSSMSFLRGFDQIMMDMLLDKPFFTEMMKRGEAVSQFIGENCLSLDLHYTNLLEIFLVPGVINPESYHDLIAPHVDNVREKLGSEKVSNSYASFMGKKGDPKSQQEGKFLSDYYFGTGESLETIKAASKYMIPGFPRLVSLSGRVLVAWPTEQILSFLKEGLDYYLKERGEYASINLISIQASSREESETIADKLLAIADFRDSYRW